jgi:hypothetical protein
VTPLSKAVGLVDARSLRLGDPLQLTFAAEICLELGEDTEHVEEALARGRVGIDRLLGRLHTRARRPDGADGADDVLQIFSARMTSQPAARQRTRADILANEIEKVKKLIRDALK